MLMTLTEAEKIVPVSRTTLYNDKKNGTLSVTKNKRGKLAVEISELERVYGNLKAPVDESQVVKSDEIKQSNIQSSSVIDELKNQIEMLKDHQSKERAIYEDQIDNLKETLSKAQEGQNKLTLLLENKSQSNGGAGDWEKSFKALEERLSNQESAIEEQRAIKQKAIRKLKAAKAELEREKNKSFFQRLFGS